MLQSVNAELEQTPTIARNSIERIKSSLPRRGGPGREPKLDAPECSVVSQEILKLIGKKYKVKDALVEVSRMCPQLIGKSVSPRTLQKAWDRRDEFLVD